MVPACGLFYGGSKQKAAILNKKLRLYFSLFIASYNALKILSDSVTDLPPFFLGPGNKCASDVFYASSVSHVSVFELQAQVSLITTVMLEASGDQSGGVSHTILHLRWVPH